MTVCECVGTNSELNAKVYLGTGSSICGPFCQILGLDSKIGLCHLKPFIVGYLDAKKNHKSLTVGSIRTFVGLSDWTDIFQKK